MIRLAPALNGEDDGVIDYALHQELELGIRFLERILETLLSINPKPSVQTKRPGTGQVAISNPLPVGETFWYSRLL
jgi:hypothetical protein